MLPFPIISNTNMLPPSVELFVSKQTAATQNVNFTVPSDVTTIHVVCVGHGSYGGGGLSWRNNITVTPGEILTVSYTTTTTNSSTSGNTSLKRGGTILCIAYCGAYGTSASKYSGGLGGKSANAINDGGGNGGTAQTTSATSVWRRGGGAGGYTGNGGNGDGPGLGGSSPYGAAAPDSGGGAGGVSAFQDVNTNLQIGGNVGLGGKGYTAPGSPYTGAGGTGSPYTVVCGAGVYSTTSNFNGGCRITTGQSLKFP